MAERASKPSGNVPAAGFPLRASQRSAARAAAAYAAMVLGAVALFLLVRRYGETLTALPAPEPGTSHGPASVAPDVLWHLLLALAAVVIAGRLLGSLFR